MQEGQLPAQVSAAGLALAPRVPLSPSADVNSPGRELAVVISRTGYSSSSISKTGADPGAER